jgi:hypothetical protein
MLFIKLMEVFGMTHGSANHIHGGKSNVDNKLFLKYSKDLWQHKHYKTLFSGCNKVPFPLTFK